MISVKQKRRPLLRPPPSRFRFRLKRQLCLHLDDSGRRISTEARTINAGRSANRLQNLPELRIVKVHHREVEIRMIEQVEEAGAHRELRPFPLRNSEALFDRKVCVEVARSAELVAALVWICGSRISKQSARRSAKAGVGNAG